MDSTNVKQEWDKWVQQFDMYACVTELDTKKEKI